MAHRTLCQASLKNQTVHYSPKTLAAFADTCTGGTKRGREVEEPTLLWIKKQDQAGISSDCILHGYKLQLKSKVKLEKPLTKNLSPFL